MRSNALNLPDAGESPLLLALAPHATTSLATKQQMAILACGKGTF
jgi:hypothetical protein